MSQKDDVKRLLVVYQRYNRKRKRKRQRQIYKYSSVIKDYIRHLSMPEFSSVWMYQ